MKWDLGTGGFSEQEFGNIFIPPPPFLLYLCFFAGKNEIKLLLENKKGQF
jgi:hypothetical protein